jgi:hypothetical protein
MLGRLAERDRSAGEMATLLQAGRWDDAREVGIDVVCAPCLDLLMPETTKAIGDRAFGADPGLVAGLGRITADSLLASGFCRSSSICPGMGGRRATAISSCRGSWPSGALLDAAIGSLPSWPTCRRHDRAHRLRGDRSRSSATQSPPGDRRGSPGCYRFFRDCC